MLSKRGATKVHEMAAGIPASLALRPGSGTHGAQSGNRLLWRSLAAPIPAQPSVGHLVVRAPIDRVCAAQAPVPRRANDADRRFAILALVEHLDAVQADGISVP